MIPGEKVASTFRLEGCKLCRSFTEVWKSGSFCVTTFNASLAHFSVLLGHMIAAAALQTITGYLHRSDCRNILIYAHTTSRTLPLCDISLLSLTLPAPEL